MAITPAFTAAVRALETAITESKQQRHQTLQIEPVKEERLDLDWAAFVPAMRAFLDRAVAAEAPIAQSAINRDGSEISVKIRDSSAPRGLRFLILSRKHLSDPRAPTDTVWLCEVGGDTTACDEVTDLVRALVKRLVGAKA